MRPPVLASRIERRLLVNYRVDPEVIAPLLPSGMRPQVVNGHAVAGICLIRLGATRPRGVPAPLGRHSENAAHRVAVEWDTAGGACRGVYIPRRDTDSALNALVGGRLFPGVHRRARFTVDERGDDLHVGFISVDGAAVAVRARVVDTLPPSELFADLAAASAFFEQSPVGWSDRARPGRLDGVELRTRAWRIEPVAVESVRSTWFDDPARFPPGSAVLDGALVMRGVPVEWIPVPSLHPTVGALSRA